MIRTETTGDVRTVTLDRPERRNALTPVGLDQLEAAVTAAGEPVVLLRGAGDAFCAGADLDVVDALADREEAVAFAEHGQRVARAIETADAVVVAGIDGAARGGGLELALACDLRVATPDATLGEPGVRIGLFGAWGGTARLPAICGRGIAMDLACSGRAIDAETALRIGLVSRIVDDPAVVAAELAAADHAALATVSRLLRNASTGRETARRDQERHEQERREAEAFAELVVGRADSAARGGERDEQ